MLYLIIILFCLIAAFAINILATSKDSRIKMLASLIVVANAVVSGVCLGLLVKFLEV